MSKVQIARAALRRFHTTAGPRDARQLTWAAFDACSAAEPLVGVASTSARGPQSCGSPRPGTTPNLSRSSPSSRIRSKAAQNRSASSQTARGLATVVGLAAPSSLSSTSSHQYSLASTSSAQAQLRSLHRLFNDDAGIDNSAWRDRLDRIARRIERSRRSPSSEPIKLLIAGSHLSRTDELVLALFDEPLRDQSAPGRSDHDVLKQALSGLGAQSLQPASLTIAHGVGEAQWVSEDRMTIDRPWLQENNLEVAIIINPASDSMVREAVYESDIVLFGTDTYALEQSAAQTVARGRKGSDTLRLASHFASKPNVHVVVNQLTDLEPSQHIPALEAAIGPAAVEQLQQGSDESVLAVSASEATSANAALRRALAGPEVQSSSLLWDEFSSRFTASKVTDVHERVKRLIAQQSQGGNLILQSAQVVIDHCLSDVVSFCVSASAALNRVSKMSAELRSNVRDIKQEASDRVWPSHSRRIAPKISNGVMSWRPTGASDASAIEVALSETADFIESTMNRRLQWWKLIWKVDDVRAELEGVCAGFASSLEATLAYESGRLATLQAQQVEQARNTLQELRSLALQLDGLRRVGRDIALFTNEAEAVRSREMSALTPTTLLEPIEHRRAQLLRVGGPIDSLASEARKLAVTTYAALGATGAGLASSSVLGASLGSGPLSMEPSSAFALLLLVSTAAAWRMQGRFAKIKARFWQDWDRLADGLDHEVKEHLDVVLERNVLAQTSFIADRLALLRAQWQTSMAAVDTQARASSQPSTRAPHMADQPAGGAEPGSHAQL